MNNSPSDKRKENKSLLGLLLYFFVFSTTLCVAVDRTYKVTTVHNALTLAHSLTDVHIAKKKKKMKN